MSKTKLLARFAAVLLVAGCNTAPPERDRRLIVAEPAAGATVSTPFTVKVETEVPLGEIETGKHHLQIWFDGDESLKQAYFSDTVQILQLAPGPHFMTVSLRKPDQSDTGIRTEVAVTVVEALPALPPSPGAPRPVDPAAPPPGPTGGAPPPAPSATPPPY